MSAPLLLLINILSGRLIQTAEQSRHSLSAAQKEVRRMKDDECHAASEIACLSNISERTVRRA